MKFTILCMCMMAGVASANYYHPYPSKDITIPPVTCPPCVCTTPKPTTTTTTKPTTTKTTTTTTTTKKPTTTTTTTKKPTTTTTTTKKPTTTTTTTKKPTTTTTTTKKPTTPLPPADPEPLCSTVVLSKCSELQDEMQHNQLLPYPGDCSRFCQCTYSQAMAQKCAEGLQFNIEIQACDWPHLARCSVSRTYAFYL